MNIYNITKQKIIYILVNKYENLDTSFFNNISCEQPKNLNFGDISTNVVMLLHKKLELNKEALASFLINELVKDDMFLEGSFVMPGFINIKISNITLINLLDNLINNKKTFGFSNIGKGKKINIEFVSANPTGPLHIGHVRGAVFGDVLAKLMQKCGFTVTKEYYVNDLGNQVSLLAKTTKLHIKNYINNTVTALEEDMYKGSYLKVLAKKIVDQKINIGDQNDLEELKQISVDYNLSIIKEDLSKLGIEFDIYTSEKALHFSNTINIALENLEKKNLLYWGTLDKPKGKEIKDWKPDKQYLFKSTKFGDTLDRAIKKSNNDWTYFASDIAYHYDKAVRGYDELINIWGADHAGYIKRLEAALKALEFKNIRLTVKLCQIVNLINENKVIKMSKRKGNFILLNDVIKHIGKDSLRFFMLIRKNDAHLDFDFEKCLTENRDNPIFYIQYANARINSIKKLIIEKNIDIKKYNKNFLRLLDTKEELDIIKKLSLWPKVIETSVHYKEPHRIVYFMIEISSMLHSFWNMGKSNEKYRIVVDNNILLTQARLSLLEAVQAVIVNGLDTLSIKPLEAM